MVVALVVCGIMDRIRQSAVRWADWVRMLRNIAGPPRVGTVIRYSSSARIFVIYGRWRVEVNIGEESGLGKGYFRFFCD